MSRSLTRIQAVVLGCVVLLGLGLLTAGVFAVGDRQWLWGEKFRVQAGFLQVRGVEIGTPVRVQGIEAGKVEAVTPPVQPGDNVMLTLQLDSKLRSLIRADATVQIVSVGMLGGTVVEIKPGSAGASLVENGAVLATRPTAELADTLEQVKAALNDVREGQGTVGKLLKDPQAYASMLAVLQQSQDTLAAFQQDAEAIKRLPVVRNYVEDPEALLVRPNCECNRQCFAEADLFQAGRAVLTTDGQHRLDELAPWLAGLKHKGSEIVIVAYADPKGPHAGVARTLTRQQSEAVCSYLKAQHAVQKMGWFSSRKVTGLGQGTSAPPEAPKEGTPAARIEVLVFVPQG